MGVLLRIAGRMGRLVPENRLTHWAERRLGESASLEMGGIGAREWVGAVVVAFFATLFFAFIIIRILIGSDFLAITFAPAVALVAACSLLSIPMMLAQGKVWKMEREIPSLISRLLSAYAERGNMHDALAAAACATECRNLSPEVKEAYANYAAGADASAAFEGLCLRVNSRYINRAFSLIVRGLESGTDVSQPLEMLSRDVSKTMELTEERNSKLGMMTWMISASSGFFYPLFAAFGLVIMAALESLASFTMYSPLEKGFVTLVLIAYLFAGVMLDSGYNGQVKYGDFKRGIVVYFPVMALAGFSVFLLAYRSLNAFVGVS